MKASEHQKGTEDCAEVPFATKIPNKGKENSTYFLFGEKKNKSPMQNQIGEGEGG